MQYMHVEMSHDVAVFGAAAAFVVVVGIIDIQRFRFDVVTVVICDWTIAIGRRMNVELNVLTRCPKFAFRMCAEYPKSKSKYVP